MDLDLRRLIVRHRDVAPMVSALLAGTDARVRIVDGDGSVILNRDGGAGLPADAARVPITAGREVLGWVEGGRVAAAVAAVLSYAANREADKRSLSNEALDRYRELSLIYDLAQSIGERLEVAAVARVALAEVGRLPGGGTAFVLLGEDGALANPDGVPGGALNGVRDGAGVVGAVAAGEPEIVNDVASDPRAAADERRFASLIAAPLVVRGRRIGVLGATTTEPHEYRAGDLKVLAAIAALTGPAIDQVRAHEAALGAPAG